MLTRKQLWRKTRISHEVACNNNGKKIHFKTLLILTNFINFLYIISLDVSEFSPRFIKYRQVRNEYKIIF